MGCFWEAFLHFWNFCELLFEIQVVLKIFILFCSLGSHSNFKLLWWEFRNLWIRWFIFGGSPGGHFSRFLKILKNADFQGFQAPGRCPGMVLMIFACAAAQNTRAYGAKHSPLTAKCAKPGCRSQGTGCQQKSVVFERFFFIFDIFVICFLKSKWF